MVKCPVCSSIMYSSMSKVGSSTEYIHRAYCEKSDHTVYLVLDKIAYPKLG